MHASVVTELAIRLKEKEVILNSNYCQFRAQAQAREAYLQGVYVRFEREHDNLSLAKSELEDRVGESQQRQLDQHAKMGSGACLVDWERSESH